MYTFSRVLLLVGGAAVLAACGQSASTAHASTALKTDAQKFGYAVGYDLGHSMQSIGTMIDVKSVEAGLEDGTSDSKARMDATQRKDIKIAMSKKIHEKESSDRAAKAKTNLAASEKFLAETAKKPGVKTTASGLEYEVLKKGDGPSPTEDDTVTVNYKGTLPDGTVFDSSYKRGKPLTFPLKNVIPGWVEGLQLMKTGAKYKFYIPSKLAYGARGAGSKIGPDQALVFEVELLKVASPADAAAAQKTDSKG